MRTVFAHLFYLSIALFVIAPPTSAQEQKPPNPLARQELSEDDVVRVNTTLVTVPVSVMDRQGRFISDLNQGQFHLYENDIEQEIAYFESAEKPFTVALLLDISDSTKFNLKDIQDAAIAFTELLRPDDRVMVVAFDRRVEMLAEATNNRRVLHEAISRAQTGGGTSLYNAVDVVVRERLSRLRGRKAIVLFTDGVDTTSLGATYDGNLRMAQELDALIYAIQYETYDTVAYRAVSQGPVITSQIAGGAESLRAAYNRANRYLRLMTDRSAGRLFHADTVGHLTEIFTRIAQELREQYSIGYYPKNQEPGADPRQLKVQVSMPKVVVRARKSYVFKPSAGNDGKQ